MKLTHKLIACLLQQPFFKGDENLHLHDTMPDIGSCVMTHESHKATTVVELVQYGIIVDEHILIVECHVCHRTDVYQYEDHHEPDDFLSSITPVPVIRG